MSSFPDLTPLFYLALVGLISLALSAFAALAGVVYFIVQIVGF